MWKTFFIASGIVSWALVITFGIVFSIDSIYCYNEEKRKQRRENIALNEQIIKLLKEIKSKE